MKPIVTAPDLNQPSRGCFSRVDSQIRVMLAGASGDNGASAALRRA